MLRLQSLSLTFFKNYEARQVSFPAPVIAITGPNGIGKTNLLDAIYYTCFTKSYFSNSDALNIQFGQEGFRIQAFYELEGKPLEVKIIHRGNKKELYKNDVPYQRISDHIGLLSAVMIAPNDIHIITDGSEYRRKYIDAILSQTNHEYLQHLINYNKVLAQRNAHLRQFPQINHGLLDVYDEQLIQAGNYIYKERDSFCAQLNPLVVNYYAAISSSKEEPQIHYQSALHSQDMAAIISQNRSIDIQAQRTREGIHKDDLAIEFLGRPFRSIASQGQLKSMLFALKLAEFSYLKSFKGFSPIILLDDVFEKLDAHRMHKLLQIVSNESDAQVMITDTHPHRIKENLTAANSTFHMIELP